MSLQLARCILIVLCSLFLGTSFARASELLSLSSPDSIVTATGVFNRALGRLHSPLRAEDWDAGSGASSIDFSVGDGRHGTFGPATYLNFNSGSYNGDNVIRIDTDQYPELEFTAFELRAPWVIRPIGSRPLVIRSQSTVKIEGRIDCNGEDGTPASTVPGATPSGGLGRCGGSNGGSGGSATSPATNGASPMGHVGGAGGAGLNEGDGGGGGAGMDITQPAFGGLDVIDVGAGGIAGTNAIDPAFAIEGGGAGGGGGSGYFNAGEPGAHASGAGGGAGGGIILIYAAGDLTIAATGVIEALGGKGGAGLPSTKAGGGGGGGGGSVLLFSGGEMRIDGTVRALANVGGFLAGADGGLSDGGDGGPGGGGRLWTADLDGPPSLDAAAIFDPMPNLAIGTIAYRLGTYEATSKLFDLDHTKPLLKALAVQTFGTGSVTVDVATSDALFEIAAADFKPYVANMPLKRFVRLKLTLENQSKTSPLMISSVSFEVTKPLQTEFEFSSCALLRKPPSSPLGSPPLSWIAVLILPMIVVLGLRRAPRLR